ncbi:MAG: hypothetical protein Q8M31_15585 [Beijerinckiaceae bacterium]|nr:hypothetical protein [Beijerinckiaceae bacterium]
MFWTRRISSVAFLVLAACALLAGAVHAQDSAPPRENLMKACGDKWRAVRDVEKTKGVTWPQFLATCRAQASGARVPPATGQAKNEAKNEASKDSSKPASVKPARQASVGGSAPVFPQDVAARHATERPALGRQRTCADQFKANKAAGTNGGLKWIEKGGGYWSRCNAHLKQTRA